MQDTKKEPETGHSRSLKLNDPSEFGQSIFRQSKDDKGLLRRFDIIDSPNKFATRNQIGELYNIPRKTLADNIKDLKHDGLINGAKIRHVAKDGRQRLQEVYDLNEVIAIGFRLRSNTAIKLQRYAANLMIEKMRSMAEEKKLLEIELSHAWHKSDQQDLYRWSR